MGTRNLTKVIDKDGTLRVAQYGQWDGYPSAQGVNILEFISQYGMLDKIEKSLVKCRFVEQQVIDNAWFAYEAQSKWDELRKDFNGFGIAFPSLSRDTGSDILKVIVYSEDVALYNDSEFENDGLFCEGVYTLNYQTREFTSWFNGDTVTVSIDKLPTVEEYLASWQVLTSTP